MDTQKLVQHLVYSYDTTFNLGERFVSALCARHPGLANTPVFPLRMMYHEYTDKKCTHNPLFENLAEDLEMLNSTKTVIITDREASIKSAIAEKLPRANHVFCYLHMFKNVDRWLASKKFKKQDRTRYHFDIKNLLWSESEEKYNQLVQKYCPNTVTEPCAFEGIDEAGNIESCTDNDDDYQELLHYIEQLPKAESTYIETIWDAKFQAYYFRYLDGDMRKSFRGAVVKFGIFNPHSGITTNASESVNALLQNSVVTDKKPTLYSLLNDVYDHQSSELLEIKKGLWDSKGNHQLHPNFEPYRNKLTEINLKRSKVLRNTEAKFLVHIQSVSRADEDVNYNSKKKDALKIVESKSVDFVRNGYWLVTDKTNSSWKVNFPKQTCDCSGKTRCVHILAVNLSLGTEGNPNFENLQYAKPTTVTEVYKRQVSKIVGKKGRGNRVPVEYEQENGLNNKRASLKLTESHEQAGEPVRHGEMRNKTKVTKRLPKEGRQRENYRKRHTLKQKFKVDECVLLRNLRSADRKSGKHIKPWYGPYKIHATHENGTYTLAQGSIVLKAKAYGGNLKPFRKRENPPVESSKVDDTSEEECQIINIIPPQKNVFAPINHFWQLEKCRLLELELKKRLQPRQTSVLLTKPNSVDRVSPDGNCVFRAISVAITRSETSHLNIRKEVIRFMRTAEVSQRLESHHFHQDIRAYITFTKMDENKVWATDCEILATAGLLETDIFIYSKFGENMTWQKFGARVCSPNCILSDKSVYLVHGSDHYDFVKSVKNL